MDSNTHALSFSALYKADPALKRKDKGIGLDLVLTPEVNTLSGPAGAFCLAGVRNVKYLDQ